MTKDYRVEIKIRNNRLLEKIEDAGYKNISQFSKAVKVGADTIGKYINMQRAPIHKITGEYSLPFMRVVDFLKCLPEDIFPKSRMSEPLKSNSVSFKGNEGDIKNLTSSLASIATDPEKKMIVDEAHKAIQDSMYALTPKQHRVLTLLYGLNGEEPKTFKEIGEEFGVTGQRIIDINKKALQKLGNNHNSKELKKARDTIMTELTQN
jgi:DNA-directed RNA polymerase sigma subunit (sigma70/sigma32)